LLHASPETPLPLEPNEPVTANTPSPHAKVIRYFYAHILQHNWMERLKTFAMLLNLNPTGT